MELGGTRPALPHLAKASAAIPGDTMLSLRVATLQAWFGQEKELAASRQRILATAKDTELATTADRAAKACILVPSADKLTLDAGLAMARKAAELGEGGLAWYPMCLGMAEYRNGNYAAADEALLTALKARPAIAAVTGTSTFYRAMILFRQGKPDEARRLATEAAAKMKPLPADEQNPLAGSSNFDEVILWLTYKEAAALIGFNTAPPPAKAESGKN